MHFCTTKRTIFHFRLCLGDHSTCVPLAFLASTQHSFRRCRQYCSLVKVFVPPFQCNKVFGCKMHCLVSSCKMHHFCFPKNNIVPRCCSLMLFICCGLSVVLLRPPTPTPHPLFFFFCTCCNLGRQVLPAFLCH